MKILLPPSETKREGGRRTRFDPARLVLPSLAPARRAVMDALVALSADDEVAARVLKLSERQRHEIVVNAELWNAPTLPAIDRYTGVLYDGIEASTLDVSARKWLGSHVWIHSAPFGPVGALDRIPNYRLAANTSLPGLAPLRRHWAGATTEAIAAARPGFVLDLRSESYVALGPLPATVKQSYLRVVTAQGRALNHFNKKAKGELVRALAVHRPLLRSAREVCEWAATAGIMLRQSAVLGELELITEA